MRPHRRRLATAAQRHAPRARRSLTEAARSGQGPVRVPAETCEEIQAEARRRGWSTSRMVQHAWELAKATIAALPGPGDGEAPE